MSLLRFHPSPARPIRTRAFGAFVALAACAVVPACGSSDGASGDQPCPGCGLDAGVDGTDADRVDAHDDAAVPDGQTPDASGGGDADAAWDAPLAEGAAPDGQAEAGPDDGSVEAGDAPAQDADQPETGEDGAADASPDAADADPPDAGPDASTDASGDEDAAPDGAASDSGVADAVSEEASTADSAAGIISGGPCLSGAAGQTAYRVKWIGSGSTPQLVYEVNGLPDKTDHTGVYGYNMSFTPQFVDPYLGDGGVLLDSSDFIDIELSTVGVVSISSITLSIFGRSFNTTASGSFNWQTFEGTGGTPYGYVSNVAPYEWYGTDLTSGIGAGNGNVLLRIKSGPPSGSLVVNRVEICMDAQ